MANNMLSRQACHAARYVVARVLRGLFWCLKYTLILPLATMALMALFVLWKDNTTPGKLLVKEIELRKTNNTCRTVSRSDLNDWFWSSDLQQMPPYCIRAVTAAADAADYVR
ncbi:IncF plasmid conjugative transfer protein TraP (plasmid) [Escherichia coli UMNK88]|uniref:conjugal transfer protein TraP n=2 Tax=Escherichia coli TaxID=562 RepID=UPI00020BF24E|nr:conjugal transfer protein TraP [Escherichia coli]AEE59866.1 IncF plasmid conjugative transfer protein TraP [Escherichia coli UMNK88]